MHKYYDLSNVCNIFITQEQCSVLCNISGNKARRESKVKYFLFHSVCLACTVALETGSWVWALSKRL